MGWIIFLITWFFLGAVGLYAVMISGGNARTELDRHPILYALMFIMFGPLLLITAVIVVLVRGWNKRKE